MIFLSFPNRVIEKQLELKIKRMKFFSTLDEIKMFNNSVFVFVYFFRATVMGLGKKIINLPETCVDDMLRGIKLTFPGLTVDIGSRIIMVNKVVYINCILK